MPSHQFEKLLEGLGSWEVRQDAGLAEIIASYRLYCAGCGTVDGVAPAILITNVGFRIAKRSSR